MVLQNQGGKKEIYHPLRDQLAMSASIAMATWKLKWKVIGRWFTNTAGRGSSIMVKYQKVWLFRLGTAFAQTVGLKI